MDRELDKLLWADTIIYITPIMWFNIPAPLVQWLSEVLVYKKTFIITEEYGEGGQVPANKFMIVATSNMKSSDLGKGVVLKSAQHIDDILQPLIMTNVYLSIREQIPTFHADNVISGDTDWIEKSYLKHLDKHF
jgi:modulator of drug activity B